jgi:hypothetical protein
MMAGAAWGSYAAVGTLYPTYADLAAAAATYADAGFVPVATMAAASPAPTAATMGPG